MEGPIFIALGAVLAAFLTGTVSFISLINSKEQKTSEFRQSWVDNLRNDIADLFSYLDSLYMSVRRVDSQNPGLKESGNLSYAKYHEQNKEDFAKLNSAFYRIVLRLNPKEHKRLIDKMKGLEEAMSGVDFYRDAELINKHRDGIATDVQAILKSEWERVKKGEPAYRISKFVAALLMVSVLLGVGVVGVSNKEYLYRALSPPSPATADGAISATKKEEKRTPSNPTPLTSPR